MKRTPIAAFGLVAAIASTAALAQAGAPPDFSPMRPGNLDSSEAQSYDTQANGTTSAPAYVAPDAPAQTENRMLEGYEMSNPPIEGRQPVVVDRYPGRIGRDRARVQPLPAQSTIGDGLFNRRGPNDFGA